MLLSNGVLEEYNALTVVALNQTNFLITLMVVTEM